ncbi:M20 aminoacylase family protein [Bordetella tumulicola]|uniref:M20 aminoacylase family protein n=1 Tax=Bordetella tumulicola TaxID=1649133 RepID=UPI0039EED68D
MAYTANPTELSDLHAFDEDLRAIRHHIHQHPELAFNEQATASFVADKLKDWGYEVTTGIGQTGVVGSLRVGAGRRSIGIRADMDALPILEETGLDYASQHQGVMHACGHDGHTTMLLGAARHLAQTRRFDGTLHLIFQPAEERGFDSGATAMLDDGLFEKFPCDYVFAIHNHPGMPLGQMLFREGPFMAAGDRVFIKVKGVGGHAARPHQAADPLVAAAHIVVALQTVVSRNVDPDEAAVVTVGRLLAGQALNVIPDSAEIGISVRSFSTEVRVLLKKRINEIVESTAAAHGVSADIDYVEGYPVLVNDAAANELAISVARELLPADQVVAETKRLMGSEDFAYMLQRCPGALVRLGNGPATDGRGLHNPKYDFNDNNLVIGAAYWSRLVETYLACSEKA